tara:strand:- start:413 stop:754 length:342 start_codon:yes stop_codon:yes gene_type:complete
MTFLKSIETCFYKYAEFKGRASRSEYWWFVLFVMICWIIGFALGPVIEIVIGLGLFLPGIAVCARRLHDLDKSGWLQLIQIIPLIGWIVIVIWCATEGQKKKNKYGPPIKLKR